MLFGLRKMHVDPARGALRDLCQQSLRFPGFRVPWKSCAVHGCSHFGSLESAAFARTGLSKHVCFHFGHGFGAQMFLQASKNASGLRSEFTGRLPKHYPGDFRKTTADYGDCKKTTGRPPPGRSWAAVVRSFLFLSFFWGGAGNNFKKIMAR